jgi:hypothetical protein
VGTLGRKTTAPREGPPGMGNNSKVRTIMKEDYRSNTRTIGNEDYRFKVMTTTRKKDYRSKGRTIMKEDYRYKR